MPQLYAVRYMDLDGLEHTVLLPADEPAEAANLTVRQIPTRDAVTVFEAVNPRVFVRGAWRELTDLDPATASAVAVGYKKDEEDS